MTIAAGARVDAGDFAYANDSITFTGGVMSSAVSAWRRGPLAGIEMSFQLGTLTHATQVAALEAAFRPAGRVSIPLGVNSTNPDSTFILIDPTGEITFFMYGTAPADSTFFRGGHTWPVN